MVSVAWKCSKTLQEQRGAPASLVILTCKTLELLFIVGQWPLATLNAVCCGGVCTPWHAAETEKPQPFDGECLKSPSIPQKKVQTTRLFGHFKSLLSAPFFPWLVR